MPFGLDASQKLTPQGLGFIFAQGNAQHFPVAEGMDAFGYHHRLGVHLHVVAEAAVEVGRIKVNVRKAGMAQRLAQKGFYLLIEALAEGVRLTCDLEMPPVYVSSTTA